MARRARLRPPGRPARRGSACESRTLEGFAQAVCNCSRNGGGDCAAPFAPDRSKHALCQAFASHLLQAAKYAPELEEQIAASEAYRELADHMPPTWLVSGSGEVLQLNRAARATDCGLTVDETGRGAQHDSARVARLFALNPRQSELADLLLAGVSLTKAALHMGISRSTANEHLRQLFEKTHTGRQGECNR